MIDDNQRPATLMKGKGWSLSEPVNQDPRNGPRQVRTSLLRPDIFHGDDS
jgi:hypothetical protein